MNLSELLTVELYNDSVKRFNQAWEETLLALGDDLDEYVSGEPVREASDKVDTHEERFDMISAGHFPEGAEKPPEI